MYVTLNGFLRRRGKRELWTFAQFCRPKEISRYSLVEVTPNSFLPLPIPPSFFFRDLTAQSKREKIMVARRRDRGGLTRNRSPRNLIVLFASVALFVGITGFEGRHLMRLFQGGGSSKHSPEIVQPQASDLYSSQGVVKLPSTMDP